MPMPLVVAALTITALSGTCPVPAPSPVVSVVTAPTPPGLTSRLRPQGRRVARWLSEAVRRSPTVARLAATVERGDVLVYLDAGRDLGTNVAAGISWMAATPAGRFVRATLRRDLPETEAIAMIAHELQHVVEVIEHPEVRSQADLVALYRRIGHTTAETGRHWDTPAAQLQGTLARAEVHLGARVTRPDTRKGT